MEHKSIKKTFCKYVALNAMGMMGLSCYILADTFFVARGLGADGLTALNLAIPVYSFINGGGAIMSDDPAQLPLVSNFSGTRNPDGALVINGRFSRIIDPAAIGKVSVNGVSYPVSGSTSASK